MFDNDKNRAEKYEKRMIKHTRLKFRRGACAGRIDGQTSKKKRTEYKKKRSRMLEGQRRLSGERMDRRTRGRQYRIDLSE